MKTLIGKFLALAAPFVIAVAIELFVLPIDFFTFRVWEALLFHDSRVRPVTGGFYPDKHVIKSEKADQLGFRDQNPKLVEWFTDAYGFRNRPEVAQHSQFDIVIIGDSNIVGSYLDQKDTIAEVLARKCRCLTYSYGSGSKRLFFSDPRFKTNSPRVIIAEARPGELYQKEVVEQVYGNGDALTSQEMPISDLPVAIAVLVDRVLKANMLEFVRSRLGVQRKLESSTNVPELTLAERTIFAEQIIFSMDDEARRRGSDFLFFLMPGGNRSLDEAVQWLARKGVKSIAYFPSSYFYAGVDLKSYYQDHDSHWREETVRYTADAILTMLNWTNYAPEDGSARFLLPPARQSSNELPLRTQ